MSRSPSSSRPDPSFILPILPAPSSAGGSVSSVPLHPFAPPAGPLNHPLRTPLPFATPRHFVPSLAWRKSRRRSMQPQPPCSLSLARDRRPVPKQTPLATCVCAQQYCTLKVFHAHYSLKCYSLMTVRQSLFHVGTARPSRPLAHCGDFCSAESPCSMPTTLRTIFLADSGLLTGTIRNVKCIWPKARAYA